MIPTAFLCRQQLSIIPNTYTTSATIIFLLNIEVNRPIQWLSRIYRFPDDWRPLLFLFLFLACPSVSLRILLCSSRYECSGIDYPFELMEAPAPSLAAEVRVAHLLLHEHLLNRDARVVHRVDLPAHRAPLVAPSQRSSTVSRSPLASTDTMAVAIQTTPQIVVRQVLPSFVPHKAC